MAIKGARLGFNDKRAGKGNVPLLVRAGERVTIRCASSLLTSESVCQLAVIIMSGCEGVCVCVCVRTFVPIGQPMCVYIYLTFLCGMDTHARNVKINWCRVKIYYSGCLLLPVVYR